MSTSKLPVFVQLCQELDTYGQYLPKSINNHYKYSRYQSISQRYKHAAILSFTLYYAYACMWSGIGMCMYVVCFVVVL